MTASLSRKVGGKRILRGFALSVRDFWEVLMAFCWWSQKMVFLVVSRGGFVGGFRGLMVSM